MYSLNNTICRSFVLTTAMIVALGSSGGLTTRLAAQCAAPREEGQWVNLDPKGDPYRLDIRMLGCADTGGNAPPRYILRAWVKQSTGQLYGRPAVNAVYRSARRQQWLYGEVPTGGYKDLIWVQAVDRNGARQLHVLITYQSLDRKPNASAEYWYRR
jgi:hypothetical protein